MTKINDYLWHLPHEPAADDPPDIVMLDAAFNQPIIDTLTGPLGELGYDLKSNDVVVKLDSQIDMADDAELKNTYIANVRFIAYLRSDVILRVHFEHTEWAHFLPEHETHRYYINLDRFKVQDPRTQIAVPAWSGRLHTRMSSDPEAGLHHDGQDQVWSYTSTQMLHEQLALFLEKFEQVGHPWLSDNTSL